MKFVASPLKCLLIGSLFLAACQPAVNTIPIPSETTDNFLSATATITNTSIPSATPELSPSLPTATPEPPQIMFCAPLEGYSFDQLESSIVNPFNPPPPGSDDPHQGIDIADLIQNSQVAIAGRPVFAMLDGYAATVTHDRFPYGNAILVETPLDLLPPDWPDQFLTLEQTENFTPNTVLTCPQNPQEPAWKTNPQQSLYILYAHLQNPVEINPGALISCGQQLGEIGQSGNALNPHLHIEIRVGPSGARFDSMAHYDASASATEMDAYCVWRVSGLFQLVDPLKLLNIGLK